MSEIQESVEEISTIDNKLANKTLDTLVQEIKNYKEQSAVSFYEIGTRLKYIKSDELYCQKVSQVLLIF